jgi:RHH-type transcriptional regulator, rel operon repressor / antitoxin RelB
MLLGIRIDEKMDKKLIALAKRHKRTKSFIAREAMEMYLDEIGDYEEALKRSRDPNAKYISEKELRRRLGL